MRPHHWLAAALTLAACVTAWFFLRGPHETAPPLRLPPAVDTRITPRVTDGATEIAQPQAPDVTVNDAGPDTRLFDATAEDAITPDDADDLDAPPQAGLTIELDTIAPADDCTLRVTSRGIVATCEHGQAFCDTIARGELAPQAGEEIVARCDHARGPVFLAIAARNEVLWAERTDRSEELSGGTCGDFQSINAELVSVAGATQRAVLVRVRGCSEPANYVDWDDLLWWNEDGFATIASASFGCSYEGATDGPDMNERGTYDCHGSYLTRAARAPDTTFALVGCEQCTQREIGTDRLMTRRGRVLRTLRWDAESARFIEPE